MDRLDRTLHKSELLVLLRVAQTRQIAHQLLEYKLKDLRQRLKAAQLRYDDFVILILIVNLAVYRSLLKLTVVLLTTLLLAESTGELLDARIGQDVGLEQLGETEQALFQLRIRGAPGQIWVLLSTLRHFGRD